MTTQQYMSYLYPCLTVAMLVLCGVLVWYWRTHVLSRLAIPVAFVLFSEVLVLLFLTLTTGTNPRFDIGQYRWLVSFVRTVMFVAALWGIRVGISLCMPVREKHVTKVLEQ